MFSSPHTPPPSSPNARAVFPNQFNPPTLQHIRIVQMLASQFSDVIVLPVDTSCRDLAVVGAEKIASMCDIAFGSIPNCRVVLRALEERRHFPTSSWSNSYDYDTSPPRNFPNEFVSRPSLSPSPFAVNSSAKRDERAHTSEREDLWICVECDNIEWVKTWPEGKSIFEESHFILYGTKPPDLTYPPNYIYLSDIPELMGNFEASLDASSDRYSMFAREQIFHHRSTSDVLTKEVRDFIDRFCLYLGVQGVISVPFSIPEDEIRAVFYVDSWSKKALELYEILKPLECKETESTQNSINSSSSHFPPPFNAAQKFTSDSHSEEKNHKTENSENNYQVDSTLHNLSRCVIRRLLNTEIPQTHNSVPSGMAVPFSPPPPLPPHHIFFDEKRPLAYERFNKRLNAILPATNANVIIVLGGDGSMLRAIRLHWRRRVPFFGINCGNIGHLLNDIEFTLESIKRCLRDGMLVHSLPLLAVEAIHLDGSKRSELSFNDAWFERSSGSPGWIQLQLNGKVKIKKLVADGLLVSTSAGTTSYAFSIGCSPIPFTSQTLALVGSNVRSPIGLRPIYLQQNECEIIMTSLDPSKRPLKARCDYLDLGESVQLRVYVSHTAEVQLAMLNNFSMMEKLLEIQFPAETEERH